MLSHLINAHLLPFKHNPLLVSQIWWSLLHSLFSVHTILHTLSNSSQSSFFLQSSLELQPKHNNLPLCNWGKIGNRSSLSLLTFHAQSLIDVTSRIVTRAVLLFCALFSAHIVYKVTFAIFAIIIRFALKF